MEVCKVSMLQISNFQKMGWLVHAGIHTFFSSKPAGQIVHRLLRCYGALCALQPVGVFRTVPYYEGKKCYVCLEFFSSLYSFLSV